MLKVGFFLFLMKYTYLSIEICFFKYVSALHILIQCYSFVFVS